MADWMRTTVESTLGPAKATRRVRTATRTPTGGTTYAYADGAFSYCSIAPMSGDELELAGKLGIRASITCRVSFDLDVDNNDRIVISDTETDELDGEWEVTYIAVSSPAIDRLLWLSRS
jgi:head-tail adaptor